MRRLRKRLREVEQIVEEIEVWQAALPAPSVRCGVRLVSAGELPLPREAHLLGVVKWLSFYLSEALVILDDYTHCHPDRIFKVLGREVEERGEGPREA